MQGKTIHRNGFVFVDTSMIHSAEPKVTRTLWPLDISPDCMPEGMESDYQIGRQEWRIYNASARRTVYVQSYTGSRVAPIYETSDVPPPKVRRGVETRWDGLRGWMKQTAKGWVPA